MSHSTDRRSFLKRAGVSLALPLLPSLRPRTAWAAAPTPKLKFISVYFANGAYMEKMDDNGNFVHAQREDLWTCQGNDTSLVLSPLLEMLRPFQNQLTQIKGTKMNFPAGAEHPSAPTGFLTGQFMGQDGRTVLAMPGKSIDWEIAAKLGTTRVPVLHLGVEQGVNTSVSHGKYTKMYYGRTSWKSQSEQFRKIDNSVEAFQEIFGSGSMSAAPTAREIAMAAKDKSIIDLFKEEIQAIKNSAANSDKDRLDQYLQSVRDLELASKQDFGSCKTTIGANFTADPVSEANKRNANFNLRTSNMIQLIVQGLACGATQVASFMLQNEDNDTDVGIRIGPCAHPTAQTHSISHFGDPSRRQYNPEYKSVQMWNTKQLLSLMEKLKQTPDVDGSSLLDNTLILYGTGLSNASSHASNNLPILLAGGLSGRIRGNRLINAQNQQYGNVLAGILQKFDIDVPKFGRGTGRLTL